MGHILLRNSARKTALGITIPAYLGLWLAGILFAPPWKRFDFPWAVLVILGAMLLLKFWRSGTLLSADGMKVRRFVGARVIPWKGISDIAVTETGMGRRVTVRLADGKSVVLAAPGDWWPTRDSNYDSSLELLMKYYEERGVRTA
jgi:hypothetical protein